MHAFSAVPQVGRRDGETVSQFVAELRRLSEHCTFDVSLDDMLRDRLMCGVRNNRVQRRLLAEPNLTFKKAFEICQGLAKKRVGPLVSADRLTVLVLVTIKS